MTRQQNTSPTTALEEGAILCEKKANEEVGRRKTLGGEKEGEEPVERLVRGKQVFFGPLRLENCSLTYRIRSRHEFTSKELCRLVMENSQRPFVSRLEDATDSVFRLLVF